MEIKHVCSLFLVVYPVYRDIKEKKICIIPALICVALGLILEAVSGGGNGWQRLA